MHTFLEFILTVVSYDVNFYYMHRLLHTRFFWPYHKKHHEDVKTSASSTFKGHIIENILQGIGGLYPFLLLYPQISYNGLLIGTVYTSVAAVVRHEPSLFNLPLLRILISDHHALHHQYFNCNYSTFWIDYLHGTHYRKSK